MTKGAEEQNLSTRLEYGIYLVDFVIWPVPAQPYGHHRRRMKSCKARPAPAIALGCASHPPAWTIRQPTPWLAERTGGRDLEAGILIAQYRFAAPIGIPTSRNRLHPCDIGPECVLAGARQSFIGRGNDFWYLKLEG